MSRDATSKRWSLVGRWICPHCKNRCKTLAGINRHLERVHRGEGYGIYRTVQELKGETA